MLWLWLLTKIADIHLNTTITIATDRIITGVYTLNVYGKMRAYTGVAGTIPGSSTTSLPYNATTLIWLNTAGGGKISIVGNSRIVFNTGEWGANPALWNLDFSMAPSQVCSSATNIKGGHITITSGAVNTQTFSVRPDSGAANTGSLIIASGAMLITNGSISRTSTLTAPAHLIDISGTLQLGGANISADAINVNDGGLFKSTRSAGHVVTGVLTYYSGSTLEYAGSLAQTTSGELRPNLYNLTITNALGVGLNASTSIANTLDLQGGGLGNTINNITMADNSLIKKKRGELAEAPLFAGWINLQYGQSPAPR